MVQEIQRLVITSDHDRYQPDPVTVRADLLFQALGAALGAGHDPKECQAFVDAIQALEIWNLELRTRCFD